MEVFITDAAFCNMLIACVETYNKECMGLLMGLRTQKGDFIVRHFTKAATDHQGFSLSILLVDEGADLDS